MEHVTSSLPKQRPILGYVERQPWTAALPYELCAAAGGIGGAFLATGSLHGALAGLLGVVLGAAAHRVHHWMAERKLRSMLR